MLVDPAADLSTIAVSGAARVGRAAIAALAVLAAIQPQCLHGPFANLDPFVRRFWYDNVSEGLPVWAR